MNILEGLQSRAAAHPAHIVLSEGQDIRIATAAIKAVAAGFGRLTLLGQKTKIAKLIDDAGGALSEKFADHKPSQPSTRKRGNNSFLRIAKT